MLFCTNLYWLSSLIGVDFAIASQKFSVMWGETYVSWSSVLSFFITAERLCSVRWKLKSCQCKALNSTIWMCLVLKYVLHWIESCHVKCYFFSFIILDVAPSIASTGARSQDTWGDGLRNGAITPSLFFQHEPLSFSASDNRKWCRISLIWDCSEISLPVS
jgi:hypothetical protein